MIEKKQFFCIIENARFSAKMNKKMFLKKLSVRTCEKSYLSWRKRKLLQKHSETDKEILHKEAVFTGQRTLGLS